MTDFGDVRAAFARNTHVEQWSHLAWALTEYDDARPVEDVFAYAAAQIERWPASIERQAPHAWLQAWWEGHPTPFLGLANLVNLIGMPWGDALVERICEEPAFQELRSLYLWGTGLGQGPWHRLFELPWPHLATLDLGANGLTVQPGALSYAHDWPSLERFVLSQNTRSPGLVEALCGFSLFPKLRELQASAIGLTREDAVGLGGAEFRPTLRCLRLGLNNLTERSLELLFDEWWPELDTLELGGNPLGDDGVQALEFTTFPKLRHLDLTGVQVGTFGLEGLLRAEWISNVETLILANNLLDDHALELLAGAEELFPKLADLRLVYNDGLSDGAKRRFRQTPWLAQCHVLEL